MNNSNLLPRALLMAKFHNRCDKNREELYACYYLLQQDLSNFSITIDGRNVQCCIPVILGNVKGASGYIK